jgi:nucleotide-binding universal stress UspA family protein
LTPASTAVREPESTGVESFGRILLASEGRPISDAAVDRVIELARRPGATAHVFSVARVHGVSFGLQTPGLLPTKREWAEQREIVAKAVKRLRRKGIEAEGHVLGTRKATKRILEEAAKEGCDAIVMAADPDRNRIVADMLWSQEPQRVRRRAKLPVFLVAGED